MVDLRHPLGHPHVIRILGFKEELEEPMCEHAVEAAGASIGSDFSQSRVSILDELSPYFLVRSDSILPRGSVNRLDNRIIEIRSSNPYLSLFQSEDAVVMPGRLPKRHER